MTCFMWSAVVCSLVWVMSEAMDGVSTWHKHTYLGKPPSLGQSRDPPKHSAREVVTTSPLNDFCSGTQALTGPGSSSGGSTQTGQTSRNGKKALTGERYDVIPLGSSLAKS